MTDADVALDRAVALPRGVAEPDVQDADRDRTGHVPCEEASIGHVRLPGQRGHDGPHDRDPPSEEDGASALHLEIALGAFPSRLTDPTAEGTAPQPRAEVPAQLVADRVSGDRPGDGGHD